MPVALGPSGFLEVRADVRGKVELRFNPRDRAVSPKVFRDDVFVCDTVPLDRVANMHRLRRRVTGEPAPHVEPTGIDPLGLLVEEHTQATRLAHLALKIDDNDNDNDDDHERTDHE